MPNYLLFLKFSPADMAEMRTAAAVDVIAPKCLLDEHTAPGAWSQAIPRPTFPLARVHRRNPAPEVSRPSRLTIEIPHTLSLAPFQFRLESRPLCVPRGLTLLAHEISNSRESLSVSAGSLDRTLGKSTIRTPRVIPLPVFYRSFQAA